MLMDVLQFNYFSSVAGYLGTNISEQFIKLCYLFQHIFLNKKLGHVLL